MGNPNLITLGTVDVVLLGDEGLGADGVLAGAADEALLVPLPRLVLHLLHPGLEDVPAGVAPRRELGVIAGAAVDPVRLRAELFVHQAGPALAALETALVPVLLLVGKILQTSHLIVRPLSFPSPDLAVDADHLPALVAVVGEDALVAADAVGMFLPEDVPVAGQTVVTVVAEQHLVLHLSLLAQRHGALSAVTSRDF